MNDNTTKLIETLAKKLGTTSEYLWGILLKQAPISASIELVFMLFVIIFGYFLLKSHKYLSVDDNEQSYYNKEGYAPIMAILGAVWLVFFLSSIFSISTIINGYFNPEYWALEKILSSLK